MEGESGVGFERVKEFRGSLRGRDKFGIGMMMR